MSSATTAATVIMEAAPTNSTVPEVVATNSELLTAAMGGDLDFFRIQTSPDREPGPLQMRGPINPDEDTVLHALAASGDTENYLSAAEVVYGKDPTLLSARNKMGDTPLHCATRAGNARMLSKLIAFAEAERRTAEVLQAQNKRGETLLHEAVRRADEDMIQVLVAADPHLASVRPVPEGSASPLYLATSLGFARIVQFLIFTCPAASYAGPNGENALHAAVVRSEELTETLLNWRKELASEADESQSTPLHFAASIPRRDVDIINFFCFYITWAKRGGIAVLLLDANRTAVYRADNEGYFPIHVAAAVGALGVLRILLHEFPDCASLRDAKGRTFLHVAISKRRTNIVRYCCRRLPKGFLKILNSCDNDGNTALHLAVENKDQSIFHSLMRNRKVCLNFENKNRFTPLDLAVVGLDRRLVLNLFLFNPDRWIASSLVFAGANFSAQRWDWFIKTHSAELQEDDGKIAEQTKNSSEMRSITAVLVVTVTFAAAFTLPGGYRADDHINGGTPTLVKTYAFQAFIIANTIAFVLSASATVGFSYSGITTVEAQIRERYMEMSNFFLYHAVRSMFAAFALGVYVVLAPVAHETAILIFGVTFAAQLYGNTDMWQALTHAATLQTRLGFRTWLCQAPNEFAIFRMDRIPVPSIGGLLGFALRPTLGYAFIFGLPLLLSHWKK